MSPPAFVRKSIIVLSLALGVNDLMGQATVSPLGGEYAIIGALPGDQVLPSIALNAAGGIIAFQEGNKNPLYAAEYGQDIGGAMLDSAGNMTGSVFRANKAVIGNQLTPQVALLANGFTLYVWQSKVAGTPDIYLRLADTKKNASGYGTNFYTADVLVNTYIRDAQINPAVAALPDGSAIATWQSYGTDGGKFGIYARKILPTGLHRFGTVHEFQVNQFISNQHNPAVAALQDGSGGYVIAWISEREKTAQGVDVYARVFSAAGAPRTDEFAVDSAAGDCSSPAVAALPDGSFTVVWNQRDLAVPTNSFDIWGRNFNTSGNPTGPDFRINTYLYGDQYNPKIASGPSGSLVVWTSLAQDGSQEGIFGRFLAGGTQPSGDEIPVNTTTLSHQIHPAVAWNGVDRFVVVWASFVGSTGYDLYGQAYTLNQ
jgi:hypothetical protein